MPRKMVDGFDDISHIPSPIRSQDLRADQRRTRRHANVGCTRTRVRTVSTMPASVTAASNDPRHMRAMPVVVVATQAHAVGAGKVESRTHTVAQVRVVPNAGVEHSNTHSTPGRSPKRRAVDALPHLIRTDRLRRHRRHRVDTAVLFKTAHLRVASQVRNLVGRSFKHATSHHPLHQTEPVLPTETVHHRLGGRQDDLKHVGRLAGEF